MTRTNDDEQIPKPYTDIAQCVRAAGFSCATQPFSRTLQRLVCATQGGSWGLAGNSFWILRRRGKWIVSTWLPEPFVLPETDRRIELVLALLRHEPPVDAHIPEDIVAQYGLVRISL